MAASGVWIHNLQIITLMLNQLRQVTIWLSVWIIKTYVKSALLILEMNKVQHVKWFRKQSLLQKSPAQQIPG